MNERAEECKSRALECERAAQQLFATDSVLSDLFLDSHTVGEKWPKKVNTSNRDDIQCVRGDRVPPLGTRPIISVGGGKRRSSRRSDTLLCPQHTNLGMMGTTPCTFSLTLHRTGHSDRMHARGGGESSHEL